MAKYVTETGHQIDRIVIYNNLLCYFYSNIINFYILLFHHISMANLLIYWSVCHYYNSLLLAYQSFTEVISQHGLVDTLLGSMRETSQDKPRSG